MALNQTQKTGAGWERVRKAVLERGSLRSPLWHWMRANRDRLSALFEREPPAWAVLAGTFGAMGLTDRAGQCPTAETARKTWYRVRRTTGSIRAKAAGPANGPSAPDAAVTRPGAVSPPPCSPPSPDPPVPHMRGPGPPPGRVIFDPEYTEMERPRFQGPARLRGRLPAQQEEEA